MSNIVPMRHDVAHEQQPTLEQVKAAYPRQQGMHYLDRVWLFVTAEVKPAELLSAFQRYAKYVVANSVPYERVRGIRSYIEDKCWNDSYELPKASVGPSYDGQKAMREKMQAKAAAGDRFSADWLKRNP